MMIRRFLDTDECSQGPGGQEFPPLRTAALSHCHQSGSHSSRERCHTSGRQSIWLWEAAELRWFRSISPADVGPSVVLTDFSCGFVSREEKQGLLTTGNKVKRLSCLESHSAFEGQLKRQWKRVQQTSLTGVDPGARPSGITQISNARLGDLSTLLEFPMLQTSAKT